MRNKSVQSNVLGKKIQYFPCTGRMLTVHAEIPISMCWETCIGACGDVFVLIQQKLNPTPAELSLFVAKCTTIARKTDFLLVYGIEHA